MTVGRGSVNETDGFDLLVVVAIGRSGSTLVQGLLNGLPATEVTGENHFLVYRLYQSYDAIRRAHEAHGSRPDSSQQPTGAWFGADRLAPEAALESLRVLAEEQLWPETGEPRGPIRTRGFKEIRWHLMQPEEVPGFADFLSACFGRVGWVLHVRDRGELRRSGWWARRPPEEVDARAEHLEGIHEALRRVVEPTCLFESTYAQITGEFPRWSSRLIEWAGHGGVPGVLERLQSIRDVVHSRPTRSS